MPEIDELKKRVDELEDKVHRLLQISDPERHPFTYLTVEMDLTKEQVAKLFDLMDEASKSLLSGKPMHHVEFEKRVYEMVPKYNGDYHFAESIIRTLNDTGQYTDVYRYMKKSGMNLR
jgi:tetrahydromethanopterin S-methyltransferase subunit B